MPQDTERDAKSVQKLFDATVKKLLATPPRPNSSKERPAQRKARPKAAKKR